MPAGLHLVIQLVEVWLACLQCPLQAHNVEHSPNWRTHLESIDVNSNKRYSCFSVRSEDLDVPDLDLVYELAIEYIHYS